MAETSARKSTSFPTSPGCRTCVPEPRVSVSSFAIDPRTPISVGRRPQQGSLPPSVEPGFRRILPAGEPSPATAATAVDNRTVEQTTNKWISQDWAEGLRVEALARDGCDLRSTGADRGNRPAGC